MRCLRRKIKDFGARIFGVRISKCLTLDKLNPAVGMIFLFVLALCSKNPCSQKLLSRVPLYQVVNNLGGLVGKIHDHFFIILYPVIQMTGKILIDLTNYRHAQF